MTEDLGFFQQFFLLQSLKILSIGIVQLSLSLPSLWSVEIGLLQLHIDSHGLEIQEGKLGMVLPDILGRGSMNL